MRGALDPERTMQHFTNAGMLLTQRGKDSAAQIAREVLADLSWSEERAAGAVRRGSEEVALRGQVGAHLPRCCVELFMHCTTAINWTEIDSTFRTSLIPLEVVQWQILCPSRLLPKLHGGVFSNNITK